MNLTRKKSGNFRIRTLKNKAIPPEQILSRMRIKGTGYCLQQVLNLHAEKITWKHKAA